MGIAEWMRIVDTVGGLAQMTGKLRPRAPETGLAESGGAAPGGLEARLAGVVVAALKEAFDRDRARMDLERTQVEAERRRAEALLAAELRRQTAERALAQLRLIAIVAVAAWMLSAALATWIPGMHARVPRMCLGAGWILAFGALGTALSAARGIVASTDALAADPSSPAGRASSGAGAGGAAAWLLLAALGAIAAGLLAGL